MITNFCRIFFLGGFGMGGERECSVNWDIVRSSHENWHVKALMLTGGCCPRLASQSDFCFFFLALVYSVCLQDWVELVCIALISPLCVGLISLWIYWFGFYLPLFDSITSYILAPANKRLTFSNNNYVGHFLITCLLSLSVWMLRDLL